MSIVSITGLSVSYDAVLALKDVDLDILEDDFLGVIGPNGGGKSTLVKSILELVPYKGTITRSEQIYRDGKLAIGYLPQVVPFDMQFPISVEDTILSGLISSKGLFGRFTRKDMAHVQQLMERTGIGHLAKNTVGELSGGELQRALLCRAVISEPRLLILDEPTNFVDSQFEKQLYATLGELNKKMAIVMVSHDLGTISSVVKSIVCVNKHVHRHNSNVITAEQLSNYDCPLQIVSHGHVPHTVLPTHK
ncbi:zinc ABC transporter ATP-binding protein [Bacteroidia bacterium]|nr:zinc ABC transporter ATP-binding protein [Bacteroidia bacterium]